MFHILVVSVMIMFKGRPVAAGNDECMQKRIELSNPSYVEQQIRNFKAEIQDLHAKIENNQNPYPEMDRRHGGVLFTRWGRTDCPQNISTRVYAGFAGGSRFDDSGAASGYTCIPQQPTWGPLKNHNYNSYMGYMYGAEYEVPHTMFGVENTGQNVPCVVCEATPYSMVLMIPGRINCYPTWEEAYHGNLVSGHYAHAASTEYVCMDEVPQKIPGDPGTDDNGKLFYGVKTVCGSLPCPPYENDKFLSCVVCMK